MGSRYDDELWQLAPKHGHARPGHLVRFVRELEPAGAALDLGCGDGRLTRELRADRVVAADVSAEALRRARNAVPDAEVVELEPDARVPLDDSSFDLVLCAETIEHVRDVQLFLSEIRRLLRPGGRLALTTPAAGRRTAARALILGWDRVLDPRSPHLRIFNRRSLTALLDEMGFELAVLRRERGTLLALARR